MANKQALYMLNFTPLVVLKRKEKKLILALLEARKEQCRQNQLNLCLVL